MSVYGQGIGMVPLHGSRIVNKQNENAKEFSVAGAGKGCPQESNQESNSNLGKTHRR